MGLKAEKGFTMIEAIMVIVIIGILAVIIGTPMIQGSLAWQAVSTRKNATQLARLGMDRMVREVRNVQRNANNTPNLVDLSSTCVDFVDVAGQQAVYRLNAPNLERGTGGTCAAPAGVNILVSNVTGFTITCYNNQNSPLACSVANAPNVRRLLLVLSVTVGSETVQLNSQVTFRDLLGF